MDDDQVFSDEQTRAIKKMIQQQTAQDPIRLETRDQLPLGVLSYGFQFKMIFDYVAGTSLPAVAPFDIKHGRNAAFFFTGSAFHLTGAAVIAADLFIDGVLVSQITTFANPATTHLALTPRWALVPDLTIGTHTATIQAAAGTSVDTNDRFSVTLLEIP